MIIVCEFTRKCCKAVTTTDSVFTHDKLCIRLYAVNLDARVVLINARTPMVLMEVVSQPLDQYENNGLISKFHEILSRQI